MPDRTQAPQADWTNKGLAALAAVAVSVAAAYSSQMPELCLAVGPLYAMFSAADV